MSGIFLTFEGIDGSGKSTQLRMLAGELRMRGQNVLTTIEPGGTTLGRKIREVLLENDATVDPLAELLLFAADRAQHVRQIIRPALEQGIIVISDRYADATVAYQGAGRGFDQKLTAQVVAIATDGLVPDLTLFYDLPVAEALQRTENRNTDGGSKNRLDEENIEFYERVRESYLQTAAHEPARFRTIRAASSISEIQAETLAVVTEFLKGKEPTFTPNVQQNSRK